MKRVSHFCPSITKIFPSSLVSRIHEAPPAPPALLMLRREDWVLSRPRLPGILTKGQNQPFSYYFSDNRGQKLGFCSRLFSAAGRKPGRESSFSMRIGRSQRLRRWKVLQLRQGRIAIPAIRLRMRGGIVVALRRYINKRRGPICFDPLRRNHEQ